VTNAAKQTLCYATNRAGYAMSVELTSKIEEQDCYRLCLDTLSDATSFCVLICVSTVNEKLPLKSLFYI